MGYTHYWGFRTFRDVEYVRCSPNEIPNGAELFKESVELFKKCLKYMNGKTLYPNCGPDAYKHKVAMKLCGWNGTGEPTITDELVSFNGDGSMDENCETFLIDLYGHERSFCKTWRKPYDTAVVVCLLCFKHYFGENIEIVSEGNEEELRYANEVFNAVLENC